MHFHISRVLSQVLDVEWRNNQLWGTIEILRTPSGMLLWELYAQVRCGAVWRRGGGHTGLIGPIARAIES